MSRENPFISTLEHTKSNRVVSKNEITRSTVQHNVVSRLEIGSLDVVRI